MSTKDSKKRGAAKKGRRGPRRGAWKAEFIDALEKTGNVSYAAQMAGVARGVPYLHRETDAEFRGQWDEALEKAADMLELELFRRAVKGVKQAKGVYHNGKKIGEEIVTNYSDTLLIFLMKAVRPGKFRETVRSEVSGPDGVPLPSAPAVQIYLPDNRRDQSGG